jgi:sterol desaturase/sphingolipid hydroxylase (fatty acid hydroxylase superfamily)
VFEFLYDVRGYTFWLLSASLACFVAERLLPWRKSQAAFRNQFGQDVFYLLFNGRYFGVLLAAVSLDIGTLMGDAFEQQGLPSPEDMALLRTFPLVYQFAFYWVFRDFLEWIVHNLLHRVPFLWQFHKLHHSITEMDFIGNFRFHWMEIIVYGVLTWLPLIVLGVDKSILLPLAVFTTLIGHLNHANLPWAYGPLKYVFNSPKMHIWHHDVRMHKPGGQNFGITLSVFDWIFGTVHWPKDQDQPEALGFEGQDKFPRHLLPRLLYPLSALWMKRPFPFFLK